MLLAEPCVASNTPAPRGLPGIHEQSAEMMGMTPRAGCTGTATLHHIGLSGIPGTSTTSSLVDGVVHDGGIPRECCHLSTPHRVSTEEIGVYISDPSVCVPHHPNLNGRVSGR